MKKFLVLFLLTFSLASWAQTYTVIHVLGKIYLPDQRAYMKPGIKLDSNAKLVFETPDAKAAVLSMDRGRHILERQGPAEQDKSEIVFALASVISPVRGRMSTRAGGIINKLDFEKRLGEHGIAWINDLLKFQLSPEFFPMSDDHFFFIRYDYAGQEVNKKLANSGDTLIIDKKLLFTVDGVQVAAKETSIHQLFYYDASLQKSELMTRFNFSLPGQEEALSIYQSMEDDNDRLKSSHEVFCELYGACTLNEFQAFLQSE